MPRRAGALHLRGLRSAGGGGAFGRPPPLLPRITDVVEKNRK